MTAMWLLTGSPLVDSFIGFVGGWLLIIWVGRKIERRWYG
jgi:hypothetical protein